MANNPVLLTFGMREFIILFLHALTIVVRLVRPGGMRSALAESILLKHQLLILNRSRRRTEAVTIALRRGIIHL